MGLFVTSVVSKWNKPIQDNDAENPSYRMQHFLSVNMKKIYADDYGDVRRDRRYGERQREDIKHRQEMIDKYAVRAALGLPLFD